MVLPWRKKNGKEPQKYFWLARTRYLVEIPTEEEEMHRYLWKHENRSNGLDIQCWI